MAALADAVHRSGAKPQGDVSPGPCGLRLQGRHLRDEPFRRQASQATNSEKTAATAKANAASSANTETPAPNLEIRQQ